MKQISLLLVAFGVFGIIFSVMPHAYSQTLSIEPSESTVLSGDLLNDPLAQEILQKIEESKIKIAKLEQQNYDNLQAQKFLEERRAVALERLNQDLTSWEEKWHEFSPEVAYQKFVDKKSPDVQGIYLKQFEFTLDKHNLGVDAKTSALDNGFDSPIALSEFNEAAKSTVKELNVHNEQIQPDTPSEIATKIAIIEGHANTQNGVYFYHNAWLKGDLNAKYIVEVENEREELRQVTKQYVSAAGGMTGEEFAEKVDKIKEKYAPIKENILNENSRILSEFETKHLNSVQRINEQISNNDSISSLIEAVWNSETNSIEIIRK